MYIVIRSYTTTSPVEVMDKIQKGFVPLVTKMSGFINYYVFPSDDKIVVVNMFDTQANGEASNQMAAKWVSENIADLYTSGPAIIQGETEIAQ